MYDVWLIAVYSSILPYVVVYSLPQPLSLKHSHIDVGAVLGIGLQQCDMLQSFRVRGCGSHSVFLSKSETAEYSNHGRETHQK